MYTFDDSGAFPLLRSYTTARAEVVLRTERHEGKACLRVVLGRWDDDPPGSAVVLALPLIAVEGRPEELVLDVRGDSSGCELLVEAAARCGCITYSLGKVDFSGWRGCRAFVDEPTEHWNPRDDEAEDRVDLPLQLLRFHIVMPEPCTAVDIGLGALSVTGDVRLASPGLAGGGDDA